MLTPNPETKAADALVEARAQGKTASFPLALIAFILSVSALIGALAFAAQSWVIYHDWACKTGWYSFVPCSQAGQQAAPQTSPQARPSARRSNLPRPYGHPSRAYW